MRAPESKQHLKQSYSVKEREMSLHFVPSKCHITVAVFTPVPHRCPGLAPISPKSFGEIKGKRNSATNYSLESGVRGKESVKASWRGMEFSSFWLQVLPFCSVHPTGLLSPSLATLFLLCCVAWTCLLPALMLCNLYVSLFKGTEKKGEICQGSHLLLKSPSPPVGFSTFLGCPAL